MRTPLAWSSTNLSMSGDVIPFNLLLEVLLVASVAVAAAMGGWVDFKFTKVTRDVESNVSTPVLHEIYHGHGILIITTW